jgi:hypothetical protein
MVSLVKKTAVHDCKPPLFHVLIFWPGLLYLRGATDYADAVEDEWLIVYLLRQLTISFPSLWARISDSDGEFLLVEAANVLPQWLSPEIDHNRTWIHDGKLFVIPIDETVPSTSQSLKLPEAVDYLKKRRKSLVHSPFIESEAFYRLEKYPAQISNSLHHSLITIPRKLAFTLHALPKSIAPAVEAFYLRDPLALKTIVSSASPLVFPPEDLVTVSVRFSKVLYAQLRSQHFDAPPRWQQVTEGSHTQGDAGSEGRENESRRRDLGMKLTCGFEMLANKASRSKSRTVQELAIILDDLREDGDAALPSDETIKAWPNVLRNDDESWMDINYEDFERELDGGQPEGRDGGKSGFGDQKTQDQLRKIVSRFESFLNDDRAGLEGAELDSMDIDDDDDEDGDSDLEEDSDGEDKEISFDEEEFSRMMREMMGLPPDSSRDVKSRHAKPEFRAGSDRTRSKDDEDGEILQLASEMEAELTEHGALKLDVPESSRKKIAGKEKAVASSNSVKERGLSGVREEQDLDDDDGDSDELVDVDYNLAKNILESFKSQGGMAGPTGNLLGLMGLQLPRDELDDEEEGNAKPGGSSRQTKR